MKEDDADNHQGKPEEEIEAIEAFGGWRGRDLLVGEGNAPQDPETYKESYDGQPDPNVPP
jgi:hypothetical protein